MIFASLVLVATTTIRSLAVDAMDQRLVGAEPSVGLSRFVGYPAGATQDKFTPNPKFWAKGIDFSCVSPWNSVCGAQRAGTLISKRHLIFANHFPLWKGVRILFVDNDGGVCSCHIEKTATVAGTDIAIGLLDAEVTPNIRPAKILPHDVEKYLGQGAGLPVVTFNQREKLLVSEMHLFGTNAVLPKWQGSHYPTKKAWQPFWGKIVCGDSGNPAFLLIDNEPILLYCLKHGGCGSGPALRYYRREIQAAMDELCPGYKLEEFDFTKMNVVGSCPEKR